MSAASNVSQKQSKTLIKNPDPLHKSGPRPLAVSRLNTPCVQRGQVTAVSGMNQVVSELKEHSFAREAKSEVTIPNGKYLMNELSPEWTVIKNPFQSEKKDLHLLIKSNAIINAGEPLSASRFHRKMWLDIKNMSRWITQCRQYEVYDSQLQAYHLR